MEQLLTKPVSIAYHRSKGLFILQLGDEQIKQNVCEFLHTRSFMVGKNLEEYLLNTDNQYDTIQVPLTCYGKTVTVNLAEFVRLREAYSQQMFLLKLEDLLVRKGIRAPKLF